MQNLIGEKTTTDIDFNDDTEVSESVKTEGYSKLIYSSSLATGAIGSTAFILQGSTDNSNWYTIANGGLTGIGMSAPVDVVAKYARVKVSTEAGVASTGSITVQLK